MKRARLPYRGEPELDVPESKRQFRNLKAEKRATTKTISVWMLLTLITLGGVIFSLYIDNDGYLLAVALVVFLIILTVSIGVINGLKSVDKFQKGFDVDISEESEKDINEQSEDSKNVD